MFSTLKARSRGPNRPFNIPSKPSQPTAKFARKIAMSGNKRSISEMEKSGGGEPKFVLITADALIDGRQALQNVVAQLFATLKPGAEIPTKEEIFKITIKNPQPLVDIFSQLGVTFSSQSERDIWSSLYCQLYINEVISLYPEVMDFLNQLQAHKIPLVVLTCHPDVILKLVEQAGLQRQVDLVVDKLNVFATNPEEFRSMYIQHLYMRVAEYYTRPDGGINFELSDTMLVTCTPKLLNLGKVIQAQTCWVKKLEERVEGVEADIVVRDLAELGRYFFGYAEEVNDKSQTLEVTEEDNDKSSLPHIVEEVNDNSEAMDTTDGANDKPEAMEVINEVNGKPEPMDVTEEVNDKPEVVELVEEIKKTPGVMEVVEEIKKNPEVNKPEDNKPEVNKPEVNKPEVRQVIRERTVEQMNGVIIGHMADKIVKEIADARKSRSPRTHK